MNTDTLSINREQEVKRHEGKIGALAFWIRDTRYAAYSSTGIWLTLYFGCYRGKWDCYSPLAGEELTDSS